MSRKLDPQSPALPNFLTPNAAGSLLTTAPEFAQFVLRILLSQGDPAGLKEATRREMLTPQVKLNSRLSWGLGWALEPPM